uniref:exodeoxyribonuclease III n=1 Tax=Neogobius melanostomus TaxID=47308 RepID=A0A8C6SN61_9GOBI
MDKINVLSLNARGLNSPQKRASVLDLLHRKNIHFAFIQESHFQEANTHRFSNKHYEVTASSCFTKKSKGVLIAIRRNLHYINLGAGGSGDGRITYCKIVYNGIKIALICVYAPNNFEKPFFDSLESILLDLSEYPLLIGGDFNAVRLHQEDRTGVNESYDQKLASRALQKMTNDFNLIDSWRLMNPSSRVFSYYSPRHKTFSRIDYIFVSKSLFQLICETDMIPFPLSDHRAVSCSLEVKTRQTRASRWRFNTTLLQKDDFKNELKQELDFFININKPSVEDPRILWEAVK